MSKVFGYPEFDASGEMILTTYEGDYSAMLMDVRVYKMKAGETRSFCRPGEEIAVLLLSGAVTFRFEGRGHAAARGSTAHCFQSNHEGAIIDEIHAADGVYDAIIINPGAYTHYSYAILDALKAVDVPAFEVHISRIDQRESFRAVSVTAPACVGQLCGHGFDGYLMAMDHFLEGGR